MGKVFIWVNYGQVSVYAADTYKQVYSIFSLLSRTVKDWQIDGAVDEVACSMIESNRTSAVAGVLSFLDLVNIGNHEMFQHGTGFYYVRSPFDDSSG